MRRNIFVIIIVVLTYFLQAIYLAFFPGAFATPNFLLVAACSMGFLMGKRAGIWAGFLGGLLYDLSYGSIFGLTALIFMYFGYLNGYLYKMFFEEDIRVIMISACGADFIYNLILFFIGFVTQKGNSFGACLTNIMLPEAFATLLASIPMYLIFRWFARKVQAAQLEEEQSPWLK
ncbi:MAG: rod shape-determining protein MreD [Eubacteriales bacterium]|jgi:rod shape-determining protein MreD